MSLIKPKPLKPGDTIRIIASSSPFEKEAFDSGVAILKDMGFEVSFAPGIFEKIPYLAGTDERRANELIEALENDSSQAILFARGGYGAMRLLPFLDQGLKKPLPKLVLGYSDITCLLIYLYQRYDWITFYGPVVAKDISKEAHKGTLESLKQNLTGNDCPEIISHKQITTIKPGQVTATLVGGCLSLITSLLGTPYDIDTKDKILFLEDVNEKPYAVDRMLMHLKLAGKLDVCKGLIFGSFLGPNPEEHYIETITDITKEYNIPILYNFPVGHSSPKLTIPLGLPIHLDATKKEIHLQEPTHAPH